jgi:fluoride exporter
MDLLLAVGSVALLGGVGSAIRALSSLFSGYLPWGILIANSVASFVAGFGLASGAYEIALVAGLAGGLSTFSTFAAQTFEFLKAGHRFRAIANTALNLILPALSLLTAVILL